MTKKTPLALLISVVTAVAATSVAAAATNGGHLGTSHAGHQSDGTVITSTGQRLTPAGTQLEFPGRPTAVALRPDGRTAALLNTKSSELVVVDLASHKVLQTYTNGGGSYDGLAYSPKGDRLFASDAGGDVLDLDVAKDGKLTLHGTVAAPSAPPTGVLAIDPNAASSNAYPGGLAFSTDGTPVPRALLLDECWPPHAVRRPEYVNAVIRRLRLRLEEEPSAPKHLVMVRGVGYALRP
ncbi:MAG: hypothetical protein QOJ79_1214 [Actinomycetota bacterium]|jgi:DNA-binding beta-propeller fold protein YncE|nr:hypothetical protein [Actinomycetota bacterium]